MSESGDYDPGQWAGHDFKEARRHYDVHAGRSYADAASTRASAADLVPAEIATKSAHPLLIRCDVTGSMRGWPDTIFSKLPYLDHEVRTEYLGEDAEVSFGAIGDTGDIPFQARPFSKGLDMKQQLLELKITNGGGGSDQYCECYGIAALYDARNVKFPARAGSPILIIIGDEMPHDLITRSDAQTYAKVKMEEQRLSAGEAFKELMRRYSVYLIQKPYFDETLAGDRLTGVTKTVHERWAKILGEERIALLPDPNRVVDVIFGILAKEADKIDYFRAEFEERQKDKPEYYGVVYKSLDTIHAGSRPSGPGKSRMHRPPGGKKSGDLL